MGLREKTNITLTSSVDCYEYNIIVVRVRFLQNSLNSNLFKHWEKKIIVITENYNDFCLNAKYILCNLIFMNIAAVIIINTDCYLNFNDKTNWLMVIFSYSNRNQKNFKLVV